MMHVRSTARTTNSGNNRSSYPAPFAVSWWENLLPALTWQRSRAGASSTSTSGRPKHDRCARRTCTAKHEMLQTMFRWQESPGPTLRLLKPLWCIDTPVPGPALLLLGEAICDHVRLRLQNVPKKSQMPPQRTPNLRAICTAGTITANGDVPKRELPNFTRF